MQVWYDARGMRAYRTARELIEPGESALVLYTRGDLFCIGTNRHGTTGDWDVDRKRVERLDWVVIYHRDRRAPSGANLWRARPAGLEGPILVAPHQDGRAKKPRYKIRLTELTQVGHTNADFPTFVGGVGRWELRYVSR